MRLSRHTLLFVSMASLTACSLPSQGGEVVEKQRPARAADSMAAPHQHSEAEERCEGKKGAALFGDHADDATAAPGGSEHDEHGAAEGEAAHADGDHHEEPADGTKPSSGTGGGTKPSGSSTRPTNTGASAKPACESHTHSD